MMHEFSLKYSAFLLLFVLLQLSFRSDLFSQRQLPGRTPEERRGRLEQFKKIRLMEVLNLNEEGSIRFFTRYNKFQEQLRQLERDRNAVIDHIERQLKEGEKGKAFQKDFDEFLGLGQKLVALHTNFHNGIREILTPEQVAKLVVFERNFNREISKIIQDVQRERRREMRRR